MGYNKDIFIIYGVKIQYNWKKDEEKMIKILESLYPDLMDNYPPEEILSQIETNIDGTVYRCLNFDDEDLYITCYYKIHDVTCEEDCLEIKLPSNKKRRAFKKWLIERGIDGKCKLYSKLALI